ncbi:MAG: hypothetical protein OWT28_08530 [Firmicutes bacterium]|nr:hypothetical protein [Bacillota bacterium]
MPIKGHSDMRRIPRIGKIHLGMKQTSQKSGSAYPIACDHFVVKPDESTSEAAASAFHAVYGETPREITIAFASDDPEDFFPQYLSSYKGGEGRYSLFCKGDGVTAKRSDGQGGFREMPCLYQACEFYQAKKCKELGRLQFFLPDVPGIGVWGLDSTSYHSAVNLNSAIDLVRALTGGRMKMIPLKLRLVPKVVSPDGHAKTVYVLDLRLEDVRLVDVFERLPQLGVMHSPPVEPISLDEMPTDLYVDDNLVQDLSTHESSDGDVIGSFVEAQTRPNRTGHLVALVKVATQQGELVEAITDEAPIVGDLPLFVAGMTVRVKTIPSTRFANRLELLSIVPA